MHGVEEFACCGEVCGCVCADVDGVVFSSDWIFALVCAEGFLDFLGSWNADFLQETSDDAVWCARSGLAACLDHFDARCGFDGGWVTWFEMG